MHEQYVICYMKLCHLLSLHLIVHFRTSYADSEREVNRVLQSSKVLRVYESYYSHLPRYNANQQLEGWYQFMKPVRSRIRATHEPAPE